MRASSDAVSAAPNSRRRRTSPSEPADAHLSSLPHRPLPPSHAAPAPAPAPSRVPQPPTQQQQQQDDDDDEHDDWAWLGPDVPSGWPLAPLLRSRPAKAAGLHDLAKPNRIPTVIRLVVAALLRLWWAALIITLIIVLAVKTHKGEVFAVWRHLTYPHVDPTSALARAPPPPLLTTQGAGAGATGGHLPVAPAPAPAPWAESCPGPLGVPFPYVPTTTYPNPPTHPQPAIGDHLLVGQHPDRCTTYESRYAPYSDASVGASYLLPVAQRGNTPIPPLTDIDPKARRTSEYERLATQAASWDEQDAKEETSYHWDSLHGLQRPPGMGKDARKDKGNLAWEALLRNRLYRQNRRAELLGSGSYPNWRKVLDTCYEHTAHTFRAAHPDKTPSKNDDGDDPEYATRRPDERDAIVLRAYEGFAWRQDDILNLRALIVEAGLNCAAPVAQHPYGPAQPSASANVCVRKDIRILLESKNATAAVFTSEMARLEMLRKEIPIEFWGLVEFWSVAEMKAVYPGLPGEFLHQMAAQDSYRACFMPLQKLYLSHPEYSYVWNWEMDVRSLDNYHAFLQGVEEYGRQEPLDVGMHKYDTWYVRNATASHQKWDPKVSSPHHQQAPQPEHLPPGGGEWAAEGSHPEWVPGVGKEADLISLAPLFDPRGSGWFWEYDVANYPLGERTPRRASIGTNVRLSRELLKAMNVVNAEAKKSLHCEAYPSTLVLHSQLPMSKYTSFYPQAGYTHELTLPFKGVAIPHPIYTRYVWSPSLLDAKINKKTFYRKGGEKVMRDSSYYYDSKHAKEIYSTWKHNRASCRAPALLHPIKRVD